MKKNLVMGTGRGYSWYVLEPFVRSFLKNVPSADLVLFVEGISDFTRNYLKTVGEGRIKIEPFPEYAKTGRPNNLRWKIFRDYCKIHGAEYSQILTSDTRDVIFQGDIFNEFAKYQSYFGYPIEPDNVSGAKSGVNLNYTWIMESFGKAEADKIANKTALCCGTVIGTSKEMKTFFEKMTEYMPSFDSGHDQAVMTYIVHNDLLPFKNLIKIDWISGAILTTDFLVPTHIEPKIKDNLILRLDGGVPSVVHQNGMLLKYLSDFIEKFYHQKDYRFDNRFLDINSIFDQMYHLVYNENWKDLLQVFVIYLMGRIDDFNNKIEYSVSFLGNPNRKMNEYLINIWQKLLEKNYILMPEVEILEITLQRALILAFSKGMNLNQLLQIYSLSVYAMKNNRTVSHLLKIFIYQCFMNTANIFLKNNSFKNAEVCLDKIIELNVPLDQKFYMLQSEVYRKLKKKSESVAAYQKALEFD